MRIKRVGAAFVAAAILSLALFQTTFAAQAVWNSGSGSINPTYRADLDTGSFNSFYGNDLFLDAVSSTKRYIGSETSSILRMGSRPSYSRCASAALGGHRYRTSYNVGRWFCIYTTENRFARFKILSDTNAGPLYITYKTWCKPADGC
ncbi:MAG: hypothetical protein QOJ81_2 [Chloroflexota bacterium]|jgi:hypothetical protein|nr:hypothetical protein [Chloroflexota bacterium]